MANSKFDTSLLEPIDDDKTNQEKSSKGWDPALLTPIEEVKPKKEFRAPKKEGLGTTLPRDFMIGLLNQRQNAVNLPHEIASNLEQQGQQFGESVNEALPLEKYLGQNKLPFGTNEPHKNLSSYLPNEQNDFAKLMGQTGNPSTTSWLIQKGIEHAPELYGLGKLATHFTPQRLKDLFGHNKLNKKSANIKSNINNAEEALSDIEGETAHETNQSNLLQNASNKEISSYLNEGGTHAAHAASSIAHRLNNVEKYWSSSYKNLRKDLKNSQFQMENLPQYGNDMEYALLNIKDLEFKNGRLMIKNQPEVSHELQSIIDKAPTPKDVSADTFLTKYQDFRDARYDLLQRAKDAPTAKERTALFKAYEESKPIEESVSKALNEGLGVHKAEFKRINEGYSQQIYPLRGNKVAKQALKGKIGSNTMAELEGTGEGQELMREMIKQDPELLRNIVGQRYAAKPETLKNISETTAEYLYEMPELRKIMTEQESKMMHQLEKVKQLKNKKEHTLKEKIRLEKEYKEIQEKLKQINKDRNTIWRGTKKAAAYGAALYLGGSALSKILGK